MSAGLSLRAVGMVTSVGHTAEETYTSIHAGIVRFRETHLIGLDGRRLLASPVMPVSIRDVGLPRALSLARPAIAECLTTRGGPLAQGRTAILVCTSRRKTQPAWEGLADALLHELAGAHRIEAPEALRFCVDRGHAGGMVALSRALELFDEGLADECLLVGVDSQCEPDVMQALDISSRTKSSRAPSGFIPGEAAVALCLRRGEPGARIAGWSFAEERSLAEGRPSIASALTAAAAHALEQWGGPPHALAYVYADLNGERGRAKEWVMTATRTLWSDGVQPELVHPADCVGDLGAAAMPFLIALAARRLGTASRGGVAGLVLTSSISLLRGAAVVERTEGGRER